MALVSQHPALPSVTNSSSENNLPTFRLNAPVVIRAKDDPDDDWSIRKRARGPVSGLPYNAGLSWKASVGSIRERRVT